MAGDYILSIASIMIARLRSDDVTIVLSQVSINKKCNLKSKLNFNLNSKSIMSCK